MNIAIIQTNTEVANKRRCTNVFEYVIISTDSFLEVEWHICFDYPDDAYGVTPAEIPLTLRAAEIHLPILVIGVPADSIAGFCVDCEKGRSFNQDCSLTWLRARPAYQRRLRHTQRLFKEGVLLNARFW